MREIWKDVVRYEGYYQVSNTGKVRSLDRNVKCKNSVRFYKGKELAQCRDDKGYYRVLLTVASKHKSCQIHRLVAEAFIPNPNKLPEVNHKDENPSNNCVDNLEWCTGAYNLAYGTGRERSNQAQHRKRVIQYDKAGNFIAEYDGINEAARSMGYANDATKIVQVCKGRKKLAYGYIWRYKEAE